MIKFSEEIKLPMNWCWTSIGEIVEISSGYGFPESYQGKTEGEIPFFKVGDISKAALAGNMFLSSANHYISESDRIELKAKTFQKGTMIFAKIGEALKLNRRVIINQPSLVDNNVMGLYSFSIYINSIFIFYYFQTVKLGDLSQATTVPSVRKGDIEAIQFPLPPLNEQNRIVAKIEELFTKLDAGVEALKKMQKQLKRYRQAVLRDAVTGELTKEWREEHNDELEPADELLERILTERRERWEKEQLRKFAEAGKTPKNDEWKKKYKEPSSPDIKNLTPLPDNWYWVSAAQLTSVITDGEHITPERTASGVYLLSARNIQNGFISFHKVDYVSKETHRVLCRRLEIEEGDVLLSCSGSVGRSCIAPRNLTFSLVRSVAVLKPILSNGPYLSYALRSPHLQAQIQEKMTQTAQANIFQEKIRILVFPLPPFEEQEKIVEEVERLFSVADMMEATIAQSLKQAERLRQSILKRAFEGKLVGQDPADEPAEILLERIKEERELRAKELKATGAKTKVKRAGKRG